MSPTHRGLAASLFVCALASSGCGGGSTGGAEATGGDSADGATAPADGGATDSSQPSDGTTATQPDSATAPPDTNPVDSGPGQETTEGGCGSVDEPCDLTDPQPPAWLCLDDGVADSGVCRATCDPAGTQVSCPDGSLCLPSEDAAQGFCALSECNGFFDDGCGADDKCIPAANNTNFCFDNGVGAEDETCTEHSSCGAALICSGTGEVDEAGDPIRRCVAPDCTALSSGRPCTGANEECFPVLGGDGSALDLGFCQVSCLVFGDPAAGPCSESQQCDVTTLPPQRNGEGEIIGICVDGGGGTLDAGAACDDTGPACADGLLCIGGTCRPLCDPQASTTAPDIGACDDGAGPTVCSELVVGDPPLPSGIGACFPGCRAYTGADGAGEGCGAGEWCFPDINEANSGLGQCAPAGPGDVGDACGADLAECGPGTICLGTSDTTAECTTICNPSAAPGEPGATDLICGAGHECSPLVITGEDGQPVPINIGICAERCDYDAQEPCVSGATCVPGEFAGADDDLCINGIPGGIPEGGDCTAAGLEEFNFCGPTSACLDLSGAGGAPGVLCYGLCRGSLGSTGHPDCSDQSATCTRLFEGVDFGACRTQ